MADNDTSNFPKMGESIIGSVVNISGQRSPYTMAEAKQGFGKSGTVTGTKKNKSGTLITGAQGPSPKIVAKIAYGNSGEAGKTQRNVKPLQGPYRRNLQSEGASDFGGARGAAGNSSGA